MADGLLLFVSNGDFLPAELFALDGILVGVVALEWESFRWLLSGFFDFMDLLAAWKTNEMILQSIPSGMIGSWA